MEHIDLSFDLQAMPPRSSLGFMAQLNARRFVGDCAPTDIYDFICQGKHGRIEHEELEPESTQLLLGAG